jgi:hypothetical protein
MKYKYLSFAWRNFVKALLLSAILLSAHVSYALEDSEKFYACKKSADCIKVDAGCNRKEAINKKFKAKQAALIKKNAEGASCLEPSPEELEGDKTSVASCIEKRCDLSSSAKQPGL